MRSLLRRVAPIVALLTITAPGYAQSNAGTGILLLAHGGAAAWNQRVSDLASQVGHRQPIEVAFGMATRSSIQEAIDRLVKRGVTSIVAVPLFVSSHSSVITSTEYLLGLRREAPKDLALFAKMNHGTPAAGDAHAAHMAEADGTTPVKSPVPIRMTSALDRHPIVASILASRATAISREPATEAVVIVAHGPTSDVENQQWLDDMQVLAGLVGRAVPFRSVDYLTVRDDAPAPIRDKATAELRAVVERRASESSRVLIVPLLMSYSGIEAGIRKRLDGLHYTMAEQGLAPDDRLVEWVVQGANMPAARNE